MKLHPQDSAPTAGQEYRFRIYYEDTDAGGVVYHANYLRYCERARTEALREAGIPHAEMTSLHGLMFMVRRVNLDYWAPAFLDDSLLIRTQTTHVGAASVTIRQLVHRPRDGRDLVGATIDLACVRIADQRAARMPARWRDGLRALSAATELPREGRLDDTRGR